MADLDQQRVVLGRPVYDRLTSLREEMRRAKGRTVTYDEAVEYLLDYRDSTAHMTREATR